jgi:hypothetical protein
MVFTGRISLLCSDILVSKDVASIVIALDLDPAMFARFVPSQRGPTNLPIVSLLECNAIARHLDRICGAAGRTFSKTWLRREPVDVVGLTRNDDDRESVTMIACPSGGHYKMRERLLQAILPGLAHTEEPRSHPAVGSAIALIPALHSQPFASFTAAVVSASIYRRKEFDFGEQSFDEISRSLELLWQLPSI